MSKIEKVSYHGWENNYRVSNDEIELVMTADVGPRVIHLAFIGEENEFSMNEGALGNTEGAEWINYGGHRLWHAPEIHPRTYMPDNDPVQVQEMGESIRFIQGIEMVTGIQKEIDVWLDPKRSYVKMTHRMRNHNLWEVELAPWAISVMAGGGTAILPLLPKGPHPENLLSSHSVNIWAYTDMSDARWTWGNRYILLRQENKEDVQKVGVNSIEGWGAYARNGHLFVKFAEYDPNQTYPDRGCSFEMFTNSVMLELETMGPMVKIPPQGIVEHVEHWHLLKDVPSPQNDADVDQHISPLINKLKQEQDG